MLHLELHVDGHGAGVDARGVRLLARLRLGCRRRRSLRAVLTARGGRRRRRGRRGFAGPALVHLLHVVLQLVQTLAQELVSILVNNVDLIKTRVLRNDGT